MARAIRKKSGTGVKTNWHFVWSCSEIYKMITRTDPMILIVASSTLPTVTSVLLIKGNRKLWYNQHNFLFPHNSAIL